MNTEKTTSNTRNKRRPKSPTDAMALALENDRTVATMVAQRKNIAYIVLALTRDKEDLFQCLAEQTMARVPEPAQPNPEPNKKAVKSDGKAFLFFPHVMLAKKCWHLNPFKPLQCLGGAIHFGPYMHVTTQTKITKQTLAHWQLVKQAASQNKKFDVRIREC